MQFRGNAHGEIAGVGSLWLLAALLAPVEIIGDRVAKSGLQLIESASLKGQHVPCVDYLAVKNPDLLVEFYSRHIAVMSHRRHGITPASRRNRRTDFNAPLSVS